MADSSLAEVLALVRREMPDVPAHVWAKFEMLVRLNYGTHKIYVAAHRKRRHLEALAKADEQADAEQLAQLLGVGVRRVQQLKKLK